MKELKKVVIALNLISDDSSMRKHHDDQFHSLLNAQLARAMQTLTELKTLAESVHNDRHTRTADRVAWLRKRSTARKLQVEVRDTREKLHMLLCIKTT